jgi:diacylglycerol kinase family enzyme
MTAMVQIVVTPGSGEGRALATARRLQRALKRRGRRTNVQKFKDLERLRQWLPDSEVKPSHLVCVGGDATLSAAAAAAIRLRVPFVPVPNGFGNIFARAFGHPDRSGAVLALLEHGQVRWVDAGVVNGNELFLSHRSYGVLEQIQQEVERGRAQPRKRWLRHLAYYGIARRLIFETSIPSLTVEVDGVVACERAILVTVANVETYRGFLSLTPTASPVDGLFDVFAIPRSNRLRLMVKLIQIMLRRPRRWHGVVMARGRRVVVTEKGRPPEELSVRRQVLPLLVPPGALESLEQRTIEADGPLQPPSHHVA